MALKALLKSLEGLSEDSKKLYVKKDDVYHLDVEDLPEDPKVAEFRDKNRGQHSKINELTELLKKFEGVDVDKYKQLNELEKKLKDKQLLETGKIDELIESRLAPIVENSRKTETALKEQNAQLQKQLEVKHIDEELTKLAAAKGLRPSAIPDMLGRLRQQFTLKDGKVVALDSQGATRLTEKGEAFTMEHSIEGLSKDASHLFQSSNGGSANGNANGSTTRTIDAGASGVLTLDPKSIEAIAKGEVTIQR